MSRDIYSMQISAKYFWCWEMNHSAQDANQLVANLDFAALKAYAILGSVRSQPKFAALQRWINGK